MPRFDSEGFNPEKRIDNDKRDRSVPEDENYYVNREYDYFSDEVNDNQDRNSIDLLINDFVSHQSNIDNTEIQNDHKKSIVKNKKKRSKAKPLRILTVACAVLLIFVFGATMFASSVFSKITYDDYRENKYVNSADLMSSSKVKNILLLGVDSRDPDDDKKSRSDSMMLISVDTAHNCVKMVSFLRDSWVYIPAKDTYQRLNAACTYDGYNGVVDTIEYNFGVDIDGYVVADFEMFKVLVDSVGGVEVEVSKEEAKEVTNHKKRYGGVKLDAGKYKLTGEQALAYCRIRKIDTDFMRAYRQRIVMQSILKSVKESNPISLVSMASKCAAYIETNLSKTQIMSFGMSALGCISTMVETRVPFDDTWQYKTINGNSVILIDAEKNKEILIDTIYNKTAQEMKDKDKK